MKSEFKIGNLVYHVFRPKAFGVGLIVDGPYNLIYVNGEPEGVSYTVFWVKKGLSDHGQYTLRL